MAIITSPDAVRDLYREAGSRGWVIPCFCTENLTTTEAVLSAAAEYGAQIGMPELPVTIAVTNNYPHRPQTHNYTHTRDWRTGLRLFRSDAEVLAGESGYFGKLRVMLHLDHIQHDLDAELLADEKELSRYSSIMHDASALPLEENIALTARFAERMGRTIVVEGACDEIYDAGGANHNELTTPANAGRFLKETGVDMIVANLGTEHRANAKNLRYESSAAQAVKAATGSRIVLHGTSSVPNEQVKHLYSDGICKVNIWTTLERDSSPALLSEMVRNAASVAGSETVNKLAAEGYLSENQYTDQGAKQSHFTTVYRQSIVFERMKQIVMAYLKMWYTL